MTIRQSIGNPKGKALANWRPLVAILLGLLFALPGVAQAETPKAQTDAALSGAMSCAALTKLDLKNDAEAPTAITGAKLVAATGTTAEYCAVTG